jgi:membrane-bound lytic murein transglycosylase D
MVVPINGSTREAKLPIMYAPPIPAVRAVHVVRRGDTLSGIAQRYRVRVSDLKAWNRVGRYLQVGQRITIRAR